MTKNFLMRDSSFEAAVALDSPPVVDAENESGLNFGAEKAGLDDSWVLALINTTSTLFTHISTQRPDGTWTNWAPLNPPVGRTCSSTDCQSCFNSRSYTPILVTGCGSAAFGYKLLYQKDGQHWAIQGNARPDCRYGGGVDCYVP